MNSGKGWEIVYYSSPAEIAPVAEYLDALPAREAARVVRQIDLLEEFGTNLPFPYTSHIRGSIWELRVRTGRNRHRILYFASRGNRIVLLHAFLKSSAKTPEPDIRVAEARLKDYQERLERT